MTPYWALRAALAALLLAGGDCTRAHAGPLTFLLQNVTFSDGTSLSGMFSITQYGYPGGALPTVTSVTGTSSADNAITGYNYGTSSTAFSLANPPDTTVDFYRSVAGGGELQVTFEYALDDMVANEIDPIVTAGEVSFECIGFTCPNANYTRYIVTGDAVTVPEPMSTALLGAGMLGLAAARRRSFR